VANADAIGGVGVRRSRRVTPFGRMAADFKHWWVGEVRDEVRHGTVLRRLAEESGLSPRYIFMTCMSGGIAILGLLLSSPAVVIGAMLLSPLMGPILGAGFALAEGKFTWLRLCAKAILVGTLVAIAFTALIVSVSPLQTVTEEIAARTRPNLFDLMIALFSSLAGSYAMIRGREGTIVGVAIATALMPPLAVVGFGLATWNMTVFGGALMLFITNLLTIALTATVMARLYGFRSANVSRHGLLQNFGILTIFVLLAIPLGLSLRQIAREANGQRIISRTIEDHFDVRARIDQLSIDWDAEPISVDASVLTPRFQPEANQRVTSVLERDLGIPVAVHINQFRVSADPGAAEQAALAQARAREQAEQDRRATQALVSRMALAAGVQNDAVTVDGANQRIVATAAVLPGLTLAGYRALETRVAQDAQGWTIALRPPLLPLPEITLDDGEPDDAGQRALDTIGWASTRTGVRVRLSGPEEALDKLMPELEKRGATVSKGPTPKDSGILAAWATDEQ
jgi:uncharacterized hydrophobic protein (TIGR00271 family)